MASSSSAAQVLHLIPLHYPHANHSLICLYVQDRQLFSILFQTRNGASLSPSHLWMITKIFHFKSLEIVKRNGDHPCLMVGNYNRDSRPRESTVSAQFARFQENNPGFFQKINQAADHDEAESYFIAVPYNNAGIIDDAKDDTTLCEQFCSIKERKDCDIYSGSHHFINQAIYNELRGQDQPTWLADKEGSSGKRRREDDSTLILGEASGAASTSAEERLKTQFAERERALGAAFDEKERGLKDEIAAKDNELITKNAEIAAKNNELITKNAEITAKDNQFTAKNTELELLQGNYYALQLNAQEKDARIEELSDVIRRMETDLRRMETNGAAHGGGARRDAQPLADQHIQLQAPIIQPEAPGQWDLIDSPGLLRIQIGLQEGSIKKLKEDLDAANKETQRAYKQVRDEEARWAAERAEITNNPAGTRYYCDEMASIEKAKEHLRMITAMTTRDAEKMILQLKDEILDKECAMIQILSGNDADVRRVGLAQYVYIYNKLTSDEEGFSKNRYHSKFAQDRVGKVQQAAGRGRGKR